MPPVTIKFLRDFRSSDGSINYTKDSEFLVDHKTAEALILASVAVMISTTVAE